MSKLSVYRGTTYPITGVYKENGVVTDITGAAIRMTIKTESWDTDADDSAATLTKSGSVTDAAAGEWSVTLSDTNTYFDAGDYFYDIKIELVSGAIYLLASGAFILLPTVTNRTS